MQQLPTDAGNVFSDNLPIGTKSEKKTEKGLPVEKKLMDVGFFLCVCAL